MCVNIESKQTQTISLWLIQYLSSARRIPSFFITSTIKSRQPVVEKIFTSRPDIGWGAMEPATFIILLVAVCSAECSRILVVFPMPAPSHYILGNSLARGLAEAGHDVTMISAFEEKNPPKGGKYRDVVLTGFLEQRDSK